MASEVDRENGIKWVIVGANADFLQVETSKPSNDIIPPTNHEVDFVHLLEIFNVRKDLSNYVSERHGQNQLEVLNHMLKHEEIKMLNTTTPRYHFLQIPGWVFTVDFFNRSAKNSGRSEEHTSELQSRENLVCRLLLEKKKKQSQ